MAIVEKLEDTLNGGYAGLFGEVVTEDSYGIKKIYDRLGLVVDLGANVGTFTRFAREVFPHALIVSIEPDPENFIHLKKFTDHNGVVFINKALGKGRFWKHIDAPNGAHESYLPVGMGYKDSEYESASVEGIMLDEIINTFPPYGIKSLIKIDVEGAENCIWDHKPSMAALSHFDHIMIELHYCTKIGDHASIKEMCESTVKGIMELAKTHDCHYEHIYFYATKKE